MTPEERQSIIEAALSSKFPSIWNWKRDDIERPFGPDDADDITAFETRVFELREIARNDLKSLSDDDLAGLNGDLLKSLLTVDPDKLWSRRPPPIAYGYGHPYFAPDFTYWCQMPELSLYRRRKRRYLVPPKVLRSDSPS